MDERQNLLMGAMAIGLGVSLVADAVFDGGNGGFGLAEIVTVVGSLVALGASLVLLWTLAFGSGATE